MPSQNLLGVVGSSFVELGPWRLVHWWLAAVTVAAAGWLVFSKQHRRQVADREAGWLMWHWFTGGPLEPRRALPTEQWPRRTAIAAGRTLAVAVLAAGEYVRSGAPHGTSAGTIVLAGVVVAAGMAAGTLGIIHAARRYAHYRQWIRPLHKAVWRLAGWDEHKRPTSYIKVPYDRGASGAEIILGVAPSFDWRTARVNAVIDTVKAKIDISGYTVTCVAAGGHSYIMFRPPAPMPEIVRFADPTVRELVDACSPSAPLFGLTRGGQPVVFDIDSDSPHLLLSAGTGAGKSWTLHMLAAQLMAKGALIMVLDFKRHSHVWVRHIDGVRYAIEIDEIHDLLIWAEAEAQRRNKLHDNIDLDDPKPQYPHLIIVCEEMNATMNQLKWYWNRIRERGDPPTSPAVEAMRQILYMGRQAKVHIFAVFQQATANDIGGGAARENFSVRMMAGDYSKNTWNMLVPQIEYRPGKAHKGWAMVCQGTRAIETQLVKMTPHEARALIMDRQGYELAPRSDVRVPAVSSPLGDRAGHVRVTGQLEGGVEAVTLWQASADKGRGIVALKYEALSKAAQRDRKKGLFPAPVVQDPSRPRYDPRDLQRWELLRSTSRVDEPAVIDVDETSDEGDEEGVGTEGTERMKAGRA